MKVLIFALAFAFADEATFKSTQNLMAQGKTSEALFLLEKVSRQAKAADPSAEQVFFTQAELRTGDPTEAERKWHKAKALFDQSVKAKTPTFFNEHDLATLKHVIDLRIERAEYLKQAYFTQKEANIAAIHHISPHLEFKNGVYRVHFRDKPYRIDSSAEFYKLLRNAFPGRVFKTEFHTVRIEYGRARTDHVLYDESDELKTPDKPKDDVDEYKSVEIQPLSLVGEVFSYKQQVFEEDSAGDGPTGGLFWTTLDLKNGRPAEILDFVEQDSLVAALRDDPKLKSIKGWPPMESKKTPLPDDQTLEYFKNKITGKEGLDFAFYDYDSGKDLLTIKILATPKGLPISNESYILTVQAKPTFVFRKALRKMKPESGFFMKTPLVL